MLRVSKERSMMTSAVQELPCSKLRANAAVLNRLSGSAARHAPGHEVLRQHVWVQGNENASFIKP